MARASKDLAKRLRFDRFPQSGLLPALVLAGRAVFFVIGGVAWYGLHAGTKQRQYLPGPVSQGTRASATAARRCHESYAGVPTKACLGCHADRVHSKFEVKTPDCASCHVEHRATGVFLAVANASCVDCHGELARPSPSPRSSARSARSPTIPS